MLLKYSKEILIGLLIITIIWLVQCKKNVVIPETPALQTTDEQRKVVLQDESNAQNKIDSALVREDAARYQAASLLKEKAKLQRAFNEQAAFLNELLANLPEDSSTFYTTHLKRLIDAERDKDSNCQRTIRAKDEIIVAKEMIISAKDTLIKRKQSSIDTALSNQERLEKYTTELRSILKPRAQVYAGINVVGPSYNEVAAIGPAIGYKTKKGLMFEGGVLLWKNMKHYQVGVKKVIKLR